MPDAPSTAIDAQTNRIKVFVHLARNKDAVLWRKAREAGTLVGINDETPYGYGRATGMGCDVTFSRSAPEGRVAQIVRLGWRAILGFDLVHAYRQRHAMSQADVIWTHNESQFLAVAAILPSGPNRPLLLGQAVWLFDRWARLSPPRRAFFRRLIEKVDILTVLSTENLAIARSVFPKKRSEWVQFGIPSEDTVEPVLRNHNPIRVLSLGSDRDRDWATLVEATRGQNGIEVAILSGTADRKLMKNAPNIKIGVAKSNSELHERLAASTVMCVPLRDNKHASGVTVVEEAIIAGIPVIVTDVGGLSGYFGPQEVCYVPEGDVGALQDAILTAGREPERMLAMARLAQERMRASGLGAQSYVRRHVEISHELLAERQRKAFAATSNDAIQSGAASYAQSGNTVHSSKP